MFRTHVKYLTVAVILALVLSVASVSDACCWGWRTLGCGWSSCYTASCCDPCGTSCWGLGWHRAHACGWRSGCSWGGCGWAGCGWANYGCATCDCSGWGVGCSSCGAVPAETSVPLTAPGTPTPAPAPAPTPAAPAPGIPSAPKATEIRSDSALLSMWVPEEAKVFVNGYQTKSTGTHRQYISNGLKSGLAYAYEIRVVIERDGKPVEETRTVTLVGGQRTAVAFSFASPAGLASIF